MSEKILWKPGNFIYPIPVVMASCGSDENEFNIITVGWTGTICTNPAMCYISIRPQRHSYEIIKKNMEFVINLVTRDLVFKADWCGVKSGCDFNKFKEMNLTPVSGNFVKAPLIAESPVNIECIVKEIKPLGLQDMFIAEVLGINAGEKYIDKNTGQFDLVKAEPVCYVHGRYFALGECLGKFGFSVQKKKR